MMYKKSVALFLLTTSCVSEQTPPALEQEWALEEVAPLPPTPLPNHIVEIFPASDDRGASYMEQLKDFCPGLVSMQELRRNPSTYINLSFRLAQCAEDCNIGCEEGQNDRDQHDLNSIYTSIKMNNITNKVLMLKPSSKNENRRELVYFYFDKDTGTHYEVFREPSSLIIKIQIGSCAQEIPHNDVDLAKSLESISINVKNPNKNKNFNFRSVNVARDQIKGSSETGWYFVLPESCRGIFPVYPE